MADTTAPTTTTYTGPDPGLGQFGILQSQAEKTYADAQAQLGTQRQSLLGNAGLVDNGAGGWTVNPDNQSGSYQMMNNQMAGQGAADSAALGQYGFGGGLINQQQEAMQNSYSAQAASWLDNLNNGQGGLQDIASQVKGAGDTRSSTEFQALMSDIQTAIANNQFNPANYSNIKIPGYDVQGDIAGLAASTVPDTTGSQVGGAYGGSGDGSGAGGDGKYHRQGHPHFNNYNQTHPHHQMTWAQWVRAGRPR